MTNTRTNKGQNKNTHIYTIYRTKVNRSGECLLFPGNAKHLKYVIQQTSVKKLTQHWLQKVAVISDTYINRGKGSQIKHKKKSLGTIKCTNCHTLINIKNFAITSYTRGTFYK